MNLVGKIFIVLIFVMSLVFMSFSIAVYATHRNYHELVNNDTPSADMPLGLKLQLQQSRSANQNLQNELTDLQTTYDSELELYQNTLADLEGEYQELLEDKKAHETELSNKEQKIRDTTMELKQAHETLADMRSERDQLRSEIAAARTERDSTKTEIAKRTEDLHKSRNDLSLLQARIETLAEDYARLDAIKVSLLEQGVDPMSVPPLVDGVVIAVTGPGTVEISIGEDDGLKPGHRLETFRVARGQTQYLGRIELTEVRPDRAVATILNEFRQGTIQRGDRVTTRLSDR